VVDKSEKERGEEGARGKRGRWGEGERQARDIARKRKQATARSDKHRRLRVTDWSSSQRGIVEITPSSVEPGRRTRSVSVSAVGKNWKRNTAGHTQCLQTAPDARILFPRESTIVKVIESPKLIIRLRATRERLCKVVMNATAATAAAARRSEASPVAT